MKHSTDGKRLTNKAIIKRFVRGTLVHYSNEHSNLSVRAGTKLYSYGTLIAKLTKLTKHNNCLVTNVKYSNTTSSHVSALLREIREHNEKGHKLIIVSKVDLGSEPKLDEQDDQEL